MQTRTSERRISNLPMGYDLTIAENTEQIKTLRNIWEKFQSKPNSDIDHYLHVTAEDKSIVHPHVVLLKHSGQPVALAVGRIEYERFSCKFGYKNIYSPTIKALGIVYDGLLGDFSIENSKIILDSLMQTMRQEKAAFVRFSYLKHNSPMYELVRKYPSHLTRDHLELPSKHWRMDLPENIEAFYNTRSRKHRYWLRRIRKVLESDFPGQVLYKTYTDRETLDELIVNAEDVARTSYQWGLDQGFKDSPEMRKRLNMFIDRNQLRAYILYIKNEPSAFWLGRSYCDTFHLIQTGYNPTYKKYELGTILFITMLQDIAENTDIKYVDFGFSDQPYKERFGNESWEEETVYLFAGTIHGVWLNAIRTIIGASWLFTNNRLTKYGIKDKMKRLMRDRLIKGLKDKTTKKVNESEQDLLHD